MSVAMRTRDPFKTTSPARRAEAAASYEALKQACATTSGKKIQWAVRAELVSDSPNHLWRLPASDSLAIVHPNADEAWALVRGARFLRQHQVAAIAPYFTDIITATDGQAVSFWHPCGKPSGDTSLSAWVTALTHRIDPEAAPWLREHDPFAGLLNGLDHAPLDDHVRAFLHERTAQLHEEWDHLDWPTPDTVIFGDRRMVPVHDDGVHIGLLLRRPLWRGHREWDRVAARRRSELLLGRHEDHRTYADTYLSYALEGQGPDHAHIAAWSGYRTVRDVIALTEVMDTVRRARLDKHARRLAAHRLACLRGIHPAPWNRGPR
ncbi:hypothetical protein ACFRMQ_34875 [Kitasatospora sp. NPDC056783]|uniref:hypothetical protein n=1 Tax=Kitasatospora sp. NPDC056783 TaxID=3345943 RepID=UPI0036902137